MYLLHFILVEKQLNWKNLILLKFITMQQHCYAKVFNLSLSDKFFDRRLNPPNCVAVKVALLKSPEIHAVYKNLTNAK